MLTDSEKAILKMLQEKAAKHEPTKPKRKETRAEKFERLKAEYRHKLLNEPKRAA